GPGHTVSPDHAAIPQKDQRTDLNESAGNLGYNFITKLARMAAVPRYAGKVEEFFEEYLVTEEGPGTVPFGGRNEELKRLDRWLADDQAKPRFVLAAPTGRGKSALLVHWVTLLNASGRVGHGEGSWRLVFFPISLRFSTNVPKVFYEALAARLSEVVQRDLKS